LINTAILLGGVLAASLNGLCREIRATAEWKDVSIIASEFLHDFVCGFAFVALLPDSHYRFHIWQGWKREFAAPRLPLAADAWRREAASWSWKKCRHRYQRCQCRARRAGGAATHPVLR
jgi:hypothetical protein